MNLIYPITKDIFEFSNGVKVDLNIDENVQFSNELAMKNFILKEIGNHTEFIFTHRVKIVLESKIIKGFNACLSNILI